MDDFETTVVNQELLTHFDGYVCTDQRGLCLEAQGIMITKTSGYTKSLLECSKVLTETSQPTIVIETTKGIILIKQKNNVTLGAVKLN